MCRISKMKRIKAKAFVDVIETSEDLAIELE